MHMAGGPEGSNTVSDSVRDRLFAVDRLLLLFCFGSSSDMKNRKACCWSRFVGQKHGCEQRGDISSKGRKKSRHCQASVDDDICLFMQNSIGDSDSDSYV